MSSLLEDTEKRMRQAMLTLTLQIIAEESGLTASWLSDFYLNKINDPGIRKIQKLNDYLKADRKGIPEIVNWNDFRLRLSDHFDDTRYIYEIMRDNTSLYIGGTQFIRRRLIQHEASGKFINNLPTHVKIMKAWGDFRKLERRLIFEHKPLFNKLNKDIYHD